MKNRSRESLMEGLCRIYEAARTDRVKALAICDRFDEERKRLGMTNSDVSKILGLSIITVTRFGKTDPIPTKYAHYMAKAGFDVEYVYSGGGTVDAENRSTPMLPATCTVSDN
jgi:hypothetical protein